MKSKEELDALKEEINKVNEKICELTPEELEQVNGGKGNIVDMAVGVIIQYEFGKKII